MDEVHFQQYGSRCRMWIPPEVHDPVVRHHPTRKSVAYFGAVRLSDGKFIYQREEDKFNAISTWRFLRKIRQYSGRRDGIGKVIVISDNAKYHHAKLHSQWRVQQEPGFVLDFLPAYSPDLNPIERVWKLLRRLRLHNRYFGALAEVIETVEEQFDLWCKPNDTLRKLCSVS